MRTLGIVGPGSGTLADRLVDRLDGRVALVRAEETTDGGVAARREGAATTYDLGPEGWHASGEPTTVEDVLDRLAPTHDYALVLDQPDASVQPVDEAVGERPRVGTDDTERSHGPTFGRWRL